MFKRNVAATVLSISALALFAGCAGRPALIPVSDKDLNRTSTQFAADAAKRTYPADAQAVPDAQVQAEVDHGLMNRIKLVNLSGEDWANVEIWVNQQYVVHLPTWKARELKKVNFQMFYNRDGQYFPIANSKNPVKKIEIFRDGKLSAVASTLAD